MFFAIDPASGPDRCVITDGRGSVMDAPRRGEKLVHMMDYGDTASRAVDPFDGLAVVDWRKAKRLIRNGQAMTVRISSEFI